MKILKPGKVAMRKYTCPQCGCEFAASENELDYNFGLKRYKTICPNLYCREHIELSDGEPYEEPAQDDAVKLYELMKESWPHSIGELSDLSTFLAAHGVTFKEDT